MPRFNRCQFVTAYLISTLIEVGAQAQDSNYDPWAPFDLIKVECDECRLRIDPALADDIANIERWTNESLNNLRLNLSMAPAIVDNADAIIDRVNEILGFEPDDDLRQWQHDTLGDFVRKTVWPIAPAEDFTIVVAHRDTVTDHLRSGGELPKTNYDPSSDELTTTIWFVSDGDTEQGSGENVIRELPIIIREIEDLKTTPFFEATRLNLSGPVVHELVEISIHLMIDFADGNGRWFGDGFANAITLVVLRELGMNAAADNLMASLDIAKFEEIPRTEILLRHWPNAAYEINTISVGPLFLESEQQLKLARYAWSFYECNRIMDDHGVEVVARIMRTAAEQKELESQYLVGLVSQVTGDDISARMNEYQDFGSVNDGYTMYRLRTRDAIEAGDYEAAFVAISRVLEIGIRLGRSIQNMQDAARLLGEMGRIEDAASYIDKLIMSANKNAPQQALGWHEVKVLQCVRFGRPELAYESIDPVLGVAPDHSIALLANAHRLLHASGEKDKARALAEQLLVDEQLSWPDEHRSMLEAVIKEAGGGGV